MPLDPLVAVRVAHEADAARLARFARDTFYEAFAHVVPEASMTAYLAHSFDQERVAAELADPDTCFLLAESDGVFLGYAKLHFGPALPEVRGPRPVKLWRLYTRASQQSKGIGALLVNVAINQAKKRGGETLWLTVNTGNERAIAFYERNRFRKTGYTTFQLGEELHQDYVMERSLTGEEDEMSGDGIG